MTRSLGRGFVDESNDAYPAVKSRSPHSNSTGRQVHSVIAAGVITAEERPTLHDSSIEAITATKGKKSDKRAASGYKSAAILGLYDREVRVVQPAETTD